MSGLRIMDEPEAMFHQAWLYFQRALAVAEAGREQALTAFRAGGGETLLGRLFAAA